ncbi:hypothetical protein PHYPSEUDO_006779 [Phytophthora pseudosyringae]|uniref:Trichohyalin-like n=1 Tax=Phytophthora pseudosyringae TaxID=221518 RepID=A0A8T1VKQ3_9STRA|nr:hypothetical protein PHYPSEUDO_006779 [Phytophthora pseudosyringae]
MARITWVWTVLLLCAAAAVDGEEDLDELDQLVAAKVKEMQGAFVGVERQLSAARQVAELFALEDAQLQMFALETRAKLAAVQEEVEKEMALAVLEVEGVRQAAVGNVTTWEKTLRGLREATERNRQTLQRVREKEEEKRHLQRELELKTKREMEMLQELERQREMDLERQAEEEMKRLQTLERQQKEAKQRQLEKMQELDKLREREKQRELEKKVELEQLQEEEKVQERELEKTRAFEKQPEQDAMQERISSDSAKDSDGAENTPPSVRSERASTVKRVLAWYVSVEQTVLDAAAAAYRQLVLPVVAILGFFLVLTVVIAKYNSMKRARRNRRVLYSGYPKSYRPKAKQEQKHVVADGYDLRPRMRHPIPRRDPNGFIDD